MQFLALIFTQSVMLCSLFIQSPKLLLAAVSAIDHSAAATGTSQVQTVLVVKCLCCHVHLLLQFESPGTARGGETSFIFFEKTLS